MFNTFVIIGRVAKDPTSKPVGQTTLAEITVESERVYHAQGVEKQERAVLKLDAWGNLGTRVMNDFRSGDIVRAQGRIVTSFWNDPQSGESRASNKFTVSDIDLVVLPALSDAQEPVEARAPAPQQQQQQQQRQQAPQGRPPTQQRPAQGQRPAPQGRPQQAQQQGFGQGLDDGSFQ